MDDRKQFSPAGVPRKAIMLDVKVSYEYSKNEPPEKRPTTTNEFKQLRLWVGHTILLAYLNPGLRRPNRRSANLTNNLKRG